MGTICVILAVIVTVLVLMLAQFNDVVMNMGIMYTNIVYEFSFLVVILITYALGIFSGVLLMLGQFFDTQKRYSGLKKRYDKTSINADDAEAKIELLENKVATLEQALKSKMEK
ncbi:MAG: hypothetical protein LUE64_02370 [Candidatus Gastranaerophilales bacterium]|nr:hypothetical protein [Candidatus Gastranaerophilales bacterium]